MKSKTIQLKLCFLLIIAIAFATVSEAQISPGSAVMNGPTGRIKNMLDQAKSESKQRSNRRDRVEQFKEKEEDEDRIGAELYKMPNPMHALAQVKILDPVKDVTAPPVAGYAEKVTSQHPGYVGLGNQPGGLDPSDAQIAAGPNHLVVLANADAKILNKQTGAVISTSSLATFFQWDGFVFDPRIMYDPYGQRWVALALKNATNTCATVDSKFRVLISNNSDPTQGWFYYEFDVDGANQTWMDFAKLGFNKDWICISGNVRCGSNPIGLYALPRTAAYAAGSIPYYFWNSIELGNPAFTFDMTLDKLYIVRTGNPNAAGIGYTDTWYINSAPQLFTSNSYGVAAPWQAFSTNASGYPKQVGGPAFSAVNIFGHAIFNNAVYRNGALWYTHAIFLPATGTTNRVSTQWWSVNPASGAVNQVGRIDDGSGATSEYYMSIGVNNQSDAVVTYSWFNPSFNPSAAYNYRNSADAAGQLPQGVVYYTGQAADGDGRGGDYSQVAVDPLDDQSFWVVNQVPDWDTRFALIPGYYGCYTDATFGNSNWTGYTKNEASNSITSAEMIQSPSMVDYDAAGYITLTTGFVANEGCIFRASNDGCGGFKPARQKPGAIPADITLAKTPEINDDLHIYPNPSNTFFNIRYKLKNDEDVKISIFSTDTKLVKEIGYRNKQAGTHTEMVDASKLNSGIYFAKIQRGNKVETRKIVVVH